MLGERTEVRGLYDFFSYFEQFGDLDRYRASSEQP